MKSVQSCYLCGSDTEMTVDHVPPKSFFPKPRPSNLITVDCCKQCNQSWSMDDEAIRAYFTLALTRSPAGESLWNEKVIAGTVSRSSAFREELLSKVVDRMIETPWGPIKQPALLVDHDRIDPFIVRITKGLLRHFYPDYEYKQDEFQVRMLSGTNEDIHKLTTCLKEMKYHEIGDQVFRCSHGLSGSKKGGLWLFIFFDAIWYLVNHQANPAAHLKLPPVEA